MRGRAENLEENIEANLENQGPSFLASTLDHGIGLYIHIPFCQTKCIYCDFNTYAGLNHIIPNYLQSLIKDISLWGNFLDHPWVNSIFLGGGTPSLLSSQQLKQILTAVNNSFNWNSRIEITAEINPDDVTPIRLDGYLKAGVNRLSLGVQSLDENLLRFLGRRHGPDKAIEAFGVAREVGINNINLDLMYGIPNQSMRQLEETLETVKSLCPEHISTYGLTIEKGTPLEKLVRNGDVVDPDPDLAADMYEFIGSFLSSQYLGYEISNWCLNGRECRHNLTYWKNLPYLGIGPGAHSYLCGFRFSVIDSPVQYIQKVQQWEALVSKSVFNVLSHALEQIPTLNTMELIELPLEMAETMTLGLRLSNGVKLSEFQARFGKDLFNEFGDLFNQVISMKLVDYVDQLGQQRVQLSNQGRILGNQVFWRFFSDL